MLILHWHWLDEVKLQFPNGPSLSSYTNDMCQLQVPFQYDCEIGTEMSVVCLTNEEKGTLISTDCMTEVGEPFQRLEACA